MKCRNAECPFNLQPAGNGETKSLASNCLVADSVKEVSFSKGDFIFSQDQQSCCVYALSKGVAKILSVTSDGREQIVGFANPHKLMVGLQSLSNENYADTAVAETDIIACKIRKRGLLAAVVRDPSIALRLVDAMNAQLAMTRALMRAVEHRSSAAKIASFLLLMLPKVKRSSKRFVLPVSRAEMANILGLTEETVCRQMAKMKRSGILYAPRGGIEVYDWAQLNAIANETPSASGHVAQAASGA